MPLTGDNSTIVTSIQIMLPIPNYQATKTLKKHKTEALNTKYQKSNTEYAQKHCTILVHVIS